jgi:hypothetical protein
LTRDDAASFYPRSEAPMTARFLLLLLFLGLVGVRVSSAGTPACISDYQCADGDLCNGIKRCVGGSCVPAALPLACDDADPCTTDTCDQAAGCAHADVDCPSTCGPGDDGLRCSDGTACTTGDTCSGGACVGTPLACDDGDPCTADVCDAALGCTYSEQADPPACLSSSQCGFAADHTPCVGDGDPCTQDGCLEGACRVGLNQIQRQCSDGDACNGDEFCSPVKGCEPAPPPVCDDGESCNGTETCVPASGCVAGTVAVDGTACDDAQGCTAGDACSAGACVGAPLDCDDLDAATFDLCLEPGGCLHCAPIAPLHIRVRFPAPSKPGSFTIGGAFTPASVLDPTTPAGLDVVLHDGPTVLQSSHVPGGAFAASGNGRVARFADRTGTLADGLTRLRMKHGAAGAPHAFSGKGVLAVPHLAPAPARRITLRTGGVCASGIASCVVTAGGKNERCN